MRARKRRPVVQAMRRLCQRCGAVGQGAGACCGGADIGGAALPVDLAAAGLAAVLAEVLFLFGAGFLLFDCGGSGVSSTSSGLGRNCDVPSPMPTRSSFSESG